MDRAQGKPGEGFEQRSDVGLTYDRGPSLGLLRGRWKQGDRLHGCRQEVLAGSERLLWKRWWEVFTVRTAFDYAALERG